MNIFSLLSAMLASAFLIGGVYCLTRNRKALLNIFSFLVLLSLGWWNFCYAFFYSAPDAEHAWFWHHLAAMGWTGFIAETTYYFVILTGLQNKFKKVWKQILFYIIPSVIMFYNIFGKSSSLSTEMVKSTMWNQWTYSNSLNNPWLWIYFICLVIYFCFSFYLLINWACKVKHRLKKTMAFAFVALDAFTILMGLITDIISPLTTHFFPAMANLCTAAFGAGYFLIIVRFDLFNIRNIVKDREIIQHSMEALMVTDEEDEILDVNPACQRLFGYDKEKLIGQKIYSFLDRNTYRSLITIPLKSIEAVNSVEIPLLISKTVKKQLMLSASVIRDRKQEYTGTVISIRDITILNELNEKYKKLAFIDTLTGLPNRRKTFEYLKECEENFKLTGKDFFILYMDLDNFKSINDCYGHNKGDQFLKEVASRLKECVKDDIRFIGRLSGDEFLMSGFISDKNPDFNKYLNAIKYQFEKDFMLDNISIKGGASVGFSLYSQSTDIDSMVHNADVKMYKMKQDRKSAVKRDFE